MATFIEKLEVLQTKAEEAKQILVQPRDRVYDHLDTRLKKTIWSVEKFIQNMMEKNMLNPIVFDEDFEDHLKHLDKATSAVINPERYWGL